MLLTQVVNQNYYDLLVVAKKGLKIENVLCACFTAAGLKLYVNVHPAFPLAVMRHDKAA